MDTEIKRNYLAEAYELANWPDRPVYVDGIRRLKPMPQVEHLQALVRQIEDLQARLGGEADFLNAMRGGGDANTRLHVVSQKAT